MASQLFLNVEQILDILFAELPDGVYPRDRADDPDSNKRSNSSSELRAQAQLLANLYANLEQINDDKNLTTVTASGLAPWERELFAAVQDSMLPYAVRQANLIAKFRANGGISMPAIEAIIQSYLDPLSIPFVILTSCKSSAGYPGTWTLDLSPLDLGTYLGDTDPLIGAGTGPGITALDCNLDFAAAGLTADQLASIQATAYTYEVLIFGTPDANTLRLLDQQLTALEPARSTHILVVNASLPFDPDAVDFGSAALPIMDIFDFGSGAPAATYDVYDFGGA